MQTKNVFAVLLALLAASLATPTASYGQIVYGQPPSATARFVYSSWSVDDDSGSTDITQSGFPIRAFMPLQEDLEATLYVVASSNSLDQGDGSLSLSGLGDARLQFSRSFSDDQFLVSAGLNLPTGKTKLSTSEETAVLQMLTADFLSFSQRRFGEGFGFNLLVGGARMVGEMRVGGGITYRYIGKYDPYEGAEDYDPGDMINLNAGADWENGPTMVSGNAVLSFYGKDKFQDREVFKQSTQIGLSLGVNHMPEGYRVNGSIAYTVRGRNSSFATDTASGQTVEDRFKIYGNELSLNGGLMWLPRNGWSYGPNAVLRLIAANDQDFGSSTVLGVGGTVGRRLGENGAVEVGLRYFTGSADGGNLDLSGLQVSAGVRISR